MREQFIITANDLSAAEANRLSTLIEEMDDPPLAVSINEIDEARGLWNLIAYFDNEAGAKACAVFLRSIGVDVSLALLPGTDWVRRSLEGLAPISAGRFFMHGAHDRHRRRAGGISLEIDAGTAFGTGHHATTLGCLCALDDLLKRERPRCILDVGSGTGVLAIAAARALRRAAIASDIDPEAVRVTRANAALNAACSLVFALTASGLAHPRIRANTPYDLVLANILARPLVSLAPALAGALAKGGTLILSGLTTGQSRLVLAAYRNRGLVPLSHLRTAGWSTLVLTNPRPKSKRPERCRPRR